MVERDEKEEMILEIVQYIKCSPKVDLRRICLLNCCPMGFEADMENWRWALVECCLQVES